MQLTGTQFTTASAVFGNDVSTIPDFPAEIRAPAGSLPGVSGFQLNFGSQKVRTPGDRPDVLVAMNPAALKVNIKDLKPGGTIIANKDSFTGANLEKANYETNPIEDGSLSSYRLLLVPLTELTLNAVTESGLDRKQAQRCKNFFALGLLYWLFDRPLDHTVKWIESKFARSPKILSANTLALRAGYNYAEAAEIFTTSYSVDKAELPPGRYVNVTGNQAFAMGAVTASLQAERSFFYGSYPITPASEILQELSRYKDFGVKTFQAEDEIAAIGSALGASYAGNLAMTGTSGPGLALKAEFVGLAVMTELPLVIVDVQRGGPSTGLPTKTEQADLFQALFSGNGECPVPVLAAKTPGDCYWCVLEAFRIALRYMTPVICLSDGYLALGSEPLRIPSKEDLPDLRTKFVTDPEGFHPYNRDEATLSRPYAIPGTPGLEHRIGGLEKQHITGSVSYDPDNHDYMCRLRKEKVARIANEIPPTEIFGESEGDSLVIGWGSTYGAITSAVEALQKEGHPVSSIHLRFLNPLPPDLGDILSRFKKVMVAEINLGQLNYVLRANYLRDIISLNQIRGKPFTVEQARERIKEHL